MMGFWALLSMDLFLPTPHFCIADCSIQVVMFVGKRAVSMFVTLCTFLSHNISTVNFSYWTSLPSDGSYFLTDVESDSTNV